jgi:hypothetical protein
MTMQTFTLEAFQFMMTHAGYSHRTGEPAKQGRVRCALELARAEYVLCRSAASVKWEVDCDADLSWLDQTDAEMGEGFEAFAAERRVEHERGDMAMMGAILRDADGEIVSSLWGIELPRDWYADPYRRVIEAELACEAGPLLLDPSREEAERDYWRDREVLTVV